MKESYLERQKKRIAQKIKVLVSRLDFQKDIQDLRLKWKIPSCGFATEQEFEGWDQQLMIDTDEYYEKNWPEERRQVIELRKLKKYKEAESIKNDIKMQSPLHVFNRDIWSIIIKYRISPRWYSGIRHYLIYNDTKHMGINVGVTVTMNWEHGIKQIALEIDRDTTLEDIKRVWSWARKMYKDRPAKKFQPIKNLERDKKAYELQTEGKTPDQIGDAITEEFGVDMDYSQINVAISRYKKRLNIN